MTYLDKLIAKAEAILQRGEPLPIDILIELAAAGIDLSSFDH